MSNQTNSFSNPLKSETVQIIDKLNLSVMQKHHVRLLAHCLEVFKQISVDKVSLFDEDKLLRDWCEKQSQKFDDKKFNELFYQQMSSAAKKLNFFSQTLGKNFTELELEDLITLVRQDN